MIGNIWISSALVVTAIFSASAIYKSYSDIKEAKQIQEHYEIISDIKILLAKQYNKNPQDITRDEIIAHLPKGANWEKVLLVNRNSDSSLSSDELVTISGDFILDEDQKIKLLALKAKLKNLTDVNSLSSSDGNITFEVINQDKNFIYKDTKISNQLKKTIEILDIKRVDILANSAVFTTIIEDYTPYEDIYQNLRTDAEIASDTILSDEQIKIRKRAFFRAKIEDALKNSKNSKDIQLYNSIKGLL